MSTTKTTPTGAALQKPSTLKKFVLGFLAVLGLLIAAFLLVPAVLPPDLHVERSIEIQRSPEDIYAVVSDLHQYKSWDPFSDEDPTIKTTLTGEGADTVYEWLGDQAGQGRIKIEKLEPPRSVNTRIQMLKPMEDEFVAGWILTPAVDGTRITWTFDQRVAYLKRWMRLAMDGMLGPAFDRGLNKLKTKMESTPEAQPSA